MINFGRFFSKLKQKSDDFLKRRPHRSFRHTRQRDLNRSLDIPGYWSFTGHVFQTIWSNRKVLFSLAFVYSLLTITLVGISSQDLYSTLIDTIDATENGVLNNFFGQIGKAGLLFLTAASGGLSISLTEVQQIYATIIVLLTWLSSVWLLRNILAGHKVKLRDGLYNSGSSILPTFLVSLVLLLQSLPIVIAIIGYNAALATGLLDGGIEAMLFWIAILSLLILSVYLMTSTVFALVIVTIPGMYPFKAIKTASDLVVGRRLRILLRFVWMALVVSVIWAIVLIPVILFDLWIKGLWAAISALPIVPITLLALSSLTVVWISSYVYLLYRRIITDESKPA